jgi:acetyl esterase/lipase
MQSKLIAVQRAITIGFQFHALVSAQPATAPATRPTTQPDMTPRIAENTVVLANVAYVASAAEKQKLDIYAPRGATNAPVLVFIHGGEWTKGDKSEVSYKPKFFNDNGVIFVAVNYRLSGTDHHPAQADDVASALKWVHDHIAEHGGSAQKIVLMGHSAGCHLVTLVGLDPRYLAKVGMKPSDLAGVVSWSGGAFDLPEKFKQGGMYAGYIHTNFGNDESVWRDASPINHVTDFKPLPGFLFASAEQGNATSQEASEKMVTLINSAGAHARHIVLAGKSHSLANHEVGMPGDLTGPQLLKFIRTQEFP